jgi:hypothetical protein
MTGMLTAAAVITPLFARTGLQDVESERAQERVELLPSDDAASSNLQV